MGVSLESQSLKNGRSLGGVSLRQNFVWSVGGNVGYLATQWGIMALLAKEQGAESVGVYAFGLAVTAPLMVFASMHLRLLQGTDAQERFSFSDYLGLRLLTVLFSMVLLLMICILSPFSRETQLVIGIIGLIKAIDLISDASYGLWQHKERMELIFISRVSNGVVSLLSFAFMLFVFDSMVWGLAVSAGISLLTLLTFNVYWVWRLRSDHHLSNPGRIQQKLNSVLTSITPRWSWMALREMISMGLPLAIAASLLSLDTSLPRFIVQHELGEAALGIFSALAYTMLVGSTLVDALGNATSPRLAAYFTQGQHDEFRSLLLKLLGMGVMGTVVIAVTVQLYGEELISLIYTEAFAAEKTLLLLLTVATGVQFVGTILGFGMTVTRNLKTQAWLQAIALCVGLAIYLPLTKQFGLNGVGVAAIAIAVCRTIGAIVFTKRYMSEWQRSFSPV